MRANRFRSDYVKIPTEVRFHEKVSPEPTSGCWLWTGSTTKRGYGQIHDENRKPHYAHRWSYELHRGPIPDGLHIDHLCRNRACVNPAHLEAVTPQENTRRWGATFTHCNRGHEYTEANTIRDKNGWRRCRTCHNEKVKLRGRARRAQSKGKPACVRLDFDVVAKTEAA